jgi:putative PIN family toxin of toxin-antitoxin system
MRVVFDSNIFISALILPGSQASKAILRIVNGQDVLILSREIIDEVLTVLARKFSRDKEAISRVAVYLNDLGDIVNPVRRIKVLKDDTDNRILECAVSGEADKVVTGDKGILQLKRYEGIKIITLRQYLGN